MALSDLVVRQIPFMRRYARILTGSQQLGDGLVRELLEAALIDPQLRTDLGASRAGLFRAFTRIYRSMGDALSAEDAYGSLEQQTVDSRLHRATPEARQALLLSAVEDFSTDEIGHILGCTSDQAAGMIEDALRAVNDAGRADVLIIEDEPLIAFQLEELVRAMGNNVVGIATTHDEAVALFRARKPGIILADIQLADGSSGIDAVNEILRGADVPVIFITAFPERLLTGERPEPTYLITKPFSDDFVRATIGQVMFFGSTAPVL
jgi:CheY-like chemotaxis protein/DNA-directed RNA polymerase specialized sigma24 family protein